MYCCVINYGKTQNYLLWTNEKSTISPVTRYIMYVEKICTQTFYIVIVLLYSLWLILQEIKCETKINLNHLLFSLFLSSTLWISLNQFSPIIAKTYNFRRSHKTVQLSMIYHNCQKIIVVQSSSSFFGFSVL